MAGKPYTMREMKGIVEYLTERKAFSEIRGRKMWMEFANSDKTSRSWQSLKETFLKRILPDILNPYYKLTRDEICSFRQGYDVAEREKSNRLTFRAASGDSSGIKPHENQNNLTSTNIETDVPTASINQVIKEEITELPVSSIDEALEKATGEDITAAKIPSRSRSSAETLVLQYENAEDIRKDLESPQIVNNEKKSKSLKDRLTFEYSAPLSPAVRDLLDDFETESEGSDKDSQPKVTKDITTVEIPDSEHIVENLENTHMELLSVKNVANDKADSTIEINDSNSAINDGKETSSINQVHSKIMTSKSDKADQNLVEVNSSNKQKIRNSDYENTNDSIHEKEMHENLNKEITKKDNLTEVTTSKIRYKSSDITKHDISNKTIPTTETSLPNSSDTQLPNNQEALNNDKNIVQTGNDNSEHTCNKSNLNLINPGKRSLSRDNRESKIPRLTKDTSNEVEQEVIPVIDIENSSEQEPAPKQNDITVTSKQPTVKISVDITNSNNIKKIDLKTVSEKIKEPSTSTEQDLTNSKIDEKIDEGSAKEINPCLMSVSLFEEQFNNTKYSDSEPEEIIKPQPIQNIEKETNIEEVKIAKEIPTTPVSKKEEMNSKPEAVIQREKITKTKTEFLPETVEVNKKGTEENLQKAGENKETIVEKKNTRTILLENADTDILDSGSDRETKNSTVVNNVQHASTAINAERERALANVFGFGNGGVTSSTRKKPSGHRRAHRHRRHSRTLSSNSSEWSSENDSEYISPPHRSRHSRSTKKFLKPKSSRILQDTEENKLYVIIGKNIYPVIKCERNRMNYVTYHPEDAPDTYWKQKYVEEKQKLEEVRKLLKQSQAQRSTTPVYDLTLPSTSRKSPISPKKPVEDNVQESVDLTAEKKSETKNDKMVLKIGTKTGLEYCLEGGWNQISNVMPQVVKMLHSETNNSNGQSKATTNGGTEKVEVDMELKNGEITPDPEVQQKVNKIESEIFTTIEALAKEDNTKENEEETENVTKRKVGKRRIEPSISPIISKSPAKKVKSTLSVDSKQETSTKSKRISKTKLAVKESNVDTIETEPAKNERKTTVEQTELKEEEEQEVLEQEEDEKPKRKGRPKKVEETDTEQSKKSLAIVDIENSKSPRRASLRLSKQRDSSVSSYTTVNENDGPRPRASSRQHRAPKKYETMSKPSATPSPKTSKETTDLVEDDDARYMLPPPEASKTNLRATRKNRSLPEINIIAPHGGQRNSIDSSVGYLDSDSSPMKIILPKRKRKISFTARKIVSNRRLTRRKSHPICLEFYTDSNNSSYFIPHRWSLSISQAESCDFPLTKKRNISHNNLERIDELGTQDFIHAATQNEPGDVRYFSSVSRDSLKLNTNEMIELGSSSSVSLPLSPELSVVENLSISREMITGDNHPTINEVQLNNRSGPMDYTDFMMTNVDISVPLMDQGCVLQNDIETTAKIQNKTDVVLKDCTVNLTLSKSLDQHMQNLLLESAQKSMQGKVKPIAMEVDQTPISTIKKPRARNRKLNVDKTMDVDESQAGTSKKTGAKKRSSTPQKKKALPKSKGPKDSIIEEEYLESCSAGRKSCPPVVAFIPTDENANNCSDVTFPAPKTKQKKDILKVKIQRPRAKSGSRKRSDKSPVPDSVCNDSGINDTESLMLPIDDSVDLIHNHSETCLMANECMVKSLEIVENSTSVVSVGSSRASEDSMFAGLSKDMPFLAVPISDCQENENAEAVASDDFQTADTVFLSPVMTNSSLITEDLSNSPSDKHSKWYLLEEDITNSEPTALPSGFGSNLQHIFPLACAVPNLSMISEMSRENEDSKKAFLE